MDIKVFIHLIDIPESMFIADEIISAIIDSDLINHSSVYIHCCYNFENFKQILTKVKNYNNVHIINSDALPAEYELPTLVDLKNHCDTELDESYVLYLHHKGASKVGNKKEGNIADWRNLMLYFTVSNWKECISKLEEGYDTVGVNWNSQNVTPHYSGNFWWARSSYIKTLPTIIRPKDNNYCHQFNFKNVHYRLEAEFWIGIKNPKAYSSHNSNVNHYNTKYPSTYYRK
jgi:hypothetical protein